MNDKPIYSAIFTPHIKGTLGRDISDQHITLSFGPEEEKLYEILQHSDKPIKIEIVGYGNDGKNEGLLVKILDDDVPYFNSSENVHITLSVSEDSTPVKTGDLAFDKEIPDHIPKIIYGTIGTFTAQKGVVFDKTYVENNCFDEIEKLVKPSEEKTINITEDKEIDNNVIVDFEFNGLPRYGFTPEIIQMKAYNCANGKSVTMNFESENPITVGASLAMGKITELENTNGLFNEEKFVKALNSIGADLDSDFVGFSVSTDRRVLSNYNIHIGYAIDLQDNLRLSQYESELALHGCSLEVCHKLVLGEFPEASHSDESELKALIDLYEADKELFHSKTLTVYPFGENAGMPLEIYCDVERRRADGYRWNNNNILADSLDTWVGFTEYEYSDMFLEAYREGTFFETGYFTIDEYNNLEFTDDESFYECMQSNFCKFALTEIFEINNLDEFDFEQEYEYDEYEQEYDEEENEYDNEYEKKEESNCKKEFIKNNSLKPDENGFKINEDGVLLKYVGNEKDVVVPDSVKQIDDFAFWNCSELTSVTIGNSVTSIGDKAFLGCTSLTSATIGDGVRSIGDSAFSGCFSLASITFGNNLKEIGKYAFYNCNSLKNIDIPDSVTTVGDGAFYECNNFTNISMSSNIVSIGKNVFDSYIGLRHLENVNITDIVGWCNTDFPNRTSNPLYYGKNLYLNGELITELVIPDGTKSIPHCAFSSNSLTSVTIPDSVTSIGNNAFAYCINLTNITIPNSVTSIGEDAFSNCTKLTSVTIGNSVKHIGWGAFKDCGSLSDIKIPDSVTEIETNAFDNFYNNAALETIIFEGYVENLKENIFGDSNPKTIVVKNEKMKQHLYETDNVPKGCEVKLASKELEQSQENDEITNIGEIGTDTPTNAEVGDICKEIINSDVEFVYDEVLDDKLVAAK